MYMDDHRKKQSCLPLVFCILDGWGHTKDSKFNAITQAHTPTWDRWHKNFPEILLKASGLAVGVPKGQMGNSEVGHITLGSGRVVPQSLLEINQAFESKDMAKKLPIVNLIKTLKKSGQACHLMGLFSPGGVHSHQDHILGLIKILAKEEIKVHLHLFLDGRDTPPQSALEYLSVLESQLKTYPTVGIATVMGRFHAMDRDHRWERTQKAYEAIVEGKGAVTLNPIEAIKRHYENHITDEFIPPLVLETYKGIQEKDALFMANFRADRARQLLDALVEPSFHEFSRERCPNFSHKIGMKGYSPTLEKWLEILFPTHPIKNTLGEVLSHHHFNQLRIAETEKYAHVTFFFNAGKESPFPGEERCLIPSPKVKTYDQEPAMSAREITEKILYILEQDKTDILIVNYANTDMLGHTGKIKPTIQAVEVVDQCLGEIEQAVLKKGGTLFVTADHGNAEMMHDAETHQPHTAHTTNLVPFVCITNHAYKTLRKEGELSDVAPTILEFLDIFPPKEMTGSVLIRKEGSA